MTETDGAANKATPVSVLFVCTGNICRSTMAEAVFRDCVKFGTKSQNPLIKNVDSCGTTSYHTGDDPDDRTMSVLSEKGITTYRHGARKIRIPKDFKDFEYVLAMDQSHVRSLKTLVQNAIKKGTLEESALDRIQLFGGRYGGRSSREEIEDPYYGSMDGFYDVHEQVLRSSEGLLKHIEDQAQHRGSL